MQSVAKDELLEDAISMMPFGSDPAAPNAPISLECGHTFCRSTIEDVRYTLRTSHSGMTCAVSIQASSAANLMISCKCHSAPSVLVHRCYVHSAQA